MNSFSRAKSSGRSFDSGSRAQKWRTAFSRKTS